MTRMRRTFESISEHSRERSLHMTFGDSWTDGRCSTTENGVVRPDLYQRWTDVLAARLTSQLPNEPRAVVNAGIAGNRIIPGGGNGPSALERIDRDESLKPEFACDDSVHPNAAGYKAIGEFIDLGLFKTDSTGNCRR